MFLAAGKNVANIGVQLDVRSEPFFKTRICVFGDFLKFIKNHQQFLLFSIRGQNLYGRFEVLRPFGSIDGNRDSWLSGHGINDDTQFKTCGKLNKLLKFGFYLRHS